jgi:GNAT superfamily N-acetyltransferase
VSITIRAADLDADRELIIDTLRRHLTPLSDAARYEWLYRRNPHGPAVAWIAVDAGSGEAVGMASAFPRAAVRDGGEERCWILGDFCVHEHYRTLGPALQLTRACLAGVDRGAVSFCYDFPSDSMMAVYQRLGVRPFGHMVRFATVLRWGAKLRDVAPVPVLRALLGALGSVADLRPARRPEPPRGTSLAIEDRDCDDAFDELNRATRNRFRLTMDRPAAYLNWRYRANPLYRYEIVTARAGRELQGYAVFSQTGRHAFLADLLARNDGTTGLLLREVTAVLRARETDTLSAPALMSHPLVPHLLRLGFRARESTPVVLYRGNAAAPLDAGDWPVLYGDRDS